MKRSVIAILAAFGSVALAGAVVACGTHGTAAGNHFSNWVASNAGGSNSVNSSGSVQADGDQADYDDNGNLKTGRTGQHAGNDNTGTWGNESYWIDITMPDGTTTQVKTYAKDWSRGNDGGGAIEAYLFEQAQAKLNVWFNNYEPLDTAGDDYTG